MRTRALRWTALWAALVFAGRFSGPAAKDDDPAPVSLCHAVAVRGATLYAAHSGLLLARDLTDPANPRLVGRASLPGEALGVVLEGARAYVASGLQGVSVVGLVDPWVPVPIGRYNTQGSVRGVAVQGNVVAIADDIRGLELADLTDLEKPRSLASFATRDRLRAVVWQADLLATAEAQGGIRLIDVATPSAPKILTTLDAVRPILDVAFCDGRIVAGAAGAKGVVIYAAENPKKPVLAAEIPTSGRALYVSCAGNRLVVSESGSQLELFDLSSPSSPRRIETIPLPRRASAGPAIAVGELIFIAAGPAGLGVVRRSEGAAAEILLPRPRKMSINFP